MKKEVEARMSPLAEECGAWDSQSQEDREGKSTERTVYNEVVNHIPLSASCSCSAASRGRNSVTEKTPQISSDKPFALWEVISTQACKIKLALIPCSPFRTGH